MAVAYRDDTKDLPSDQLHRLFMLAGWSDGAESPEMRRHFNAPFIYSTLVVSAWEGPRLVGAVRVLSDQTVRSVLYDLVVDPEFQNQGIGKNLVKKCIDTFPGSEWLVQTTPAISAYYEKMGFLPLHDCFLRMPSKYF